MRILFATKTQRHKDTKVQRKIKQANRIGLFSEKKLFFLNIS